MCLKSGIQMNLMKQKGLSGRGVSYGVCMMMVLMAFAAGCYLGRILPEWSRAVDGAALPLSEGDVAAPPQGRQSGQEAVALQRLQELQERVQQHSEDVDAWVALGNLYFDMHQPQEAVHAYTHALKLRPLMPDVLTDLGTMYRALGQPEEALKRFRQALAMQPDYPNALFNSGVVLFFDLGRKEEGRQVWQQLLAVQPQATTPEGTPLREFLTSLQ